MAKTELFVSGYTQAPYGAGPGVVRYALDAEGLAGESLAQSQDLVNPSFLAWGGPSARLLLAVEELPEGNVVALDGSSLALLGRASTGGADPCHVVRHDDAIWAANYSSGNVSFTELPELLANTEPEPEMLEHPGKGPVTDRQGESHSHQVVATPWETVLASDLGADRIDEYNPATLGRVVSAELPPGTGPRHMVLHGDFLLVVGELDGYLHVLRRSGDFPNHSWHWLSRTPLAATVEEIEAAADFAPSHVELRDGLLYVAVRGPNTIVVLDVSGLAQGEDASEAMVPPSFLTAVPSGGNWPRHFALAGQRMYVANQLSDAVAVLAIGEDGIPQTEPLQQLEHGSPTCVLLR